MASPSHPEEGLTPLLRPLAATFALGEARIDVLSDGATEEPLGRIFHGADDAAWTEAVGISHPDMPMPFNYGCVLVRADGRTILIDSGLGHERRKSRAAGGAGLLDRLAEAGVRPEAVDTVVHTHLHLDHLGWDCDDRSGYRPTFPNARVVVDATEFDYWTGDEVADQPGLADLRMRLDILRGADHFDLTAGDHQVSASVRTISTPGHTPGHVSVVVTSGGSSLIVLGDVAHHPVHLEHHDWLPRVDIDPARSRMSRARVAELASSGGWQITAGHFVVPTLGILTRSEGGYRWTPSSIVPEVTAIDAIPAPGSA